MKKQVSVVICFLLLFSLVVLTSSCSSNRLEGTYNVSTVLDGSAFTTDSGETVKLVGVEAPAGGEAGFGESTDHLQTLILGETVRLEKPEGVTDPESGGIYLRYVYDEADTQINHQMVDEGYAKSDTTYLNAEDTTAFEEAETRAEEYSEGLWSEGQAYGPSKWNDPTNTNVISANDAAGYYGQYKIVQGLIVKTYKYSKACFLDFRLDYKNGFVGVIFASAFSSFPYSPDSYYLNREVRISGLITQHEGHPQIIINSPSQIEVAKYFKY